MKRILIGCMAILAAASLAACGTAGQEPESSTIRAAVATADAGIREMVLFANPEGALEDIYQNLSTEPSLTPLTDESLEKLLGISPADVVYYAGYISDAKSGLSDVILVEPVEGKEDDIRQALLNYQSACIEQYRNYDILSSLSIAQNATVYSQGDYIVYLMLADNEAAQDIIDRYMPQ